MPRLLTDASGNVVTAGSTPTNALTFSQSDGALTNRPDGYSFDASGNLLNDGVHSYTYDAENRITAVDGGATATYVYDADGARVQRTANGTTTEYVYAGGQVVDEYDNGAGAGSPTREYIYGLGQRVAEIDGSTTFYYHDDHLSPRLLTDASGNVLTRQGHYPFGEMWYQNGQGTKWMFTSYPRDNETNNDYANARYFLNRFGRFMSADPADVAAQDPTNPQSWNLFTYALNNPIMLGDPTGLDCVYLNDAGNGVESIDHNSDSGECSQNGGEWSDGNSGGYQVIQNSNGDTAVVPIGTETVTVTDTAPWYDTLPEITSSALQTANAIAGAAWNWFAAPRNGACLAAGTAGGVALGYKFGGGVGAVGGLGIGDEVTVPAGMGAGALLGGAAGWTAGMISCRQGGSGSGSRGGGKNQRENQAFDEAVRRIDSDRPEPLSQDQIRRLHDEISGKEYTLKEIVDIGKAMFSH